jgi:hypothetical protein
VPEPAVLLWAAYEAPNRAAHGVLAATVQQRLTTARRLTEWVDVLRPLRRAKPFKRTLSFVDAGAHSGAELEVEGGFHLEVLEAAADARRSRRITTRSRTVVRCTAYELTHEMEEVAVDLIALGVPGRLPAGRVPDTVA